MLESLQQLAGTFPRRFLFNALLPTFAFVTLTATVLVASFASIRAASRWWTGLDNLSKIGVTLAYAIMTWCLAAAVASQWRNIVRLYEGYPLRKAFKSRTPGVRWHQEHLDELQPSLDDVQGFDPQGPPPAVLPPDVSVSFDSYYRYPTIDHRKDILPTRLGNILLAGERYSYDRYGIDCIIFWTRLWPFLPEQFQRDYEESLINYEFPLIVSFLAAASSMISGVALIVRQQPPLLFLAVFVGGFVLSYGAYYFSLSSAEELAEQQRTAFDLYRDRLLEAWPTVADIKDEKAAFRLIQRFVVDNRPATWNVSQSRHHARRT